MKKINRIWTYQLFIVLLILMLVISCKDDESPLYRKGSGVTDIDGNVYETVIINGQEWMAENLKTTRYRNGDLIGTTNPATSDVSSEIAPKYQWAYSGDEGSVNIYGRLYTWYVVTDSRNVCPIGWHIPTDADWITLTTYLGGESVAGKKLKETGTDHWPVSGTNESGFTGLPAGARNVFGGFYYLGEGCGWWSSSENGPSSAWYRFLYQGANDAYRDSNPKGNGFSVRCIRD